MQITTSCFQASALVPKRPEHSLFAKSSDIVHSKRPDQCHVLALRQQKRHRLVCEIRLGTSVANTLSPLLPTSRTIGVAPLLPMPDLRLLHSQHGQVETLDDRDLGEHRHLFSSKILAGIRSAVRSSVAVYKAATQRRV